MKLLSIVVASLFLGWHVESLTAKSEECITNLLDSTRLIKILIQQNKLATLLEEHTPQDLERLLNNFSPATLAFEAEVLSTPALVVIYYHKDSDAESTFIEQLATLAAEYDTTALKVVLIDAEQLFSLAYDAEIELFPTIILSKDREILEKIDKNITIDLLKEKIKQHQF